MESAILKRLEKNLKGLKRQRNNILQQTIKANKFEINELITKEQLAFGVRGDGAPLPEYSETSVQKYGKPRGRMILKDEGDFWEGIDAVVKKDSFTTEGKDRKTVMLQQRYGESITELSQENFKSFVNEIVKFDVSGRVKRYIITGKVK